MGDLQAGVRRGWSRHCPPQMLLSHSLIPQQAYVLVVNFFLLDLMFPLFNKKKSIYVFKILQERFVLLKMPMLFILYLFYYFFLKKKKGVFFFKKKKKKKKKKKV